MRLTRPAATLAVLALIGGPAAAQDTVPNPEFASWSKYKPGTRVVSNTFDMGDITAPFGGFGQSGFGRDKSIHALDKFTDLKSIWIQLR